METPRRTFLSRASAVLIVSSWPHAFSSAAQTKAAPKKEEAEEEVSTNEDLMREHGVLNRILLIYDEAIRRIQAKEKFDVDVVPKSAGLIKKFIEDYHEKLEEDYLFPRFEKSGKLVDLVKTLRSQHAAGRTVTDRILASVKAKDFPTTQTSLAAFVRMYRPHEAREDTVLFPALHEIVSKHEYDALGEQFEGIERKTFGGDGFHMAVDQVTDLEKQLGIYDLAQFTPKQSDATGLGTSAETTSPLTSAIRNAARRHSLPLMTDERGAEGSLKCIASRCGTKALCRELPNTVFLVHSSSGFLRLRSGQALRLRPRARSGSLRMTEGGWVAGIKIDKKFKSSRDYGARCQVTTNGSVASRVDKAIRLWWPRETHARACDGKQQSQEWTARYSSIGCTSLSPLPSITCFPNSP